MSETPRIMDYEGSTYRTDFWEGRGRNYEDLVERSILRRLLPSSGRRLLEIGAGFGRLTNEFHMYDQVVLLDYSFSQLQYARQQFGDDGFIYVAANAYQMPFHPGVFDGATMIRVLHHFENVPAVLQQIQHIMVNDGTFILEHANKRNLKAIMRYKFKKQDWNPYDLSPIEFVELNFNFHPDYIEYELMNTGFQMNRQIPVSFFRLGILKKTLPNGLLAGMDRIAQLSGWKIAPSIFTHNTVTDQQFNQLDLQGDALFACPQTGSALQRQGDYLINGAGTRWQIRDGIYDFKSPAE